MTGSAHCVVRSSDAAGTKADLSADRSDGSASASRNRHRHVETTGPAGTTVTAAEECVHVNALGGNRGCSAVGKGVVCVFGKLHLIGHVRGMTWTVPLTILTFIGPHTVPFAVACTL